MSVSRARVTIEEKILGKCKYNLVIILMALKREAGLKVNGKGIIYFLYNFYNFVKREIMVPLYYLLAVRKHTIL